MRFLVPVLALLTVAAAQVHAHGDKARATKSARPISTEAKEFGREGDPRKASRTIRVDMSDRMRFTPASITVKEGETVKFVVRNRGKTLHEMVLGTLEKLKEHAELMKKHPGMEHNEPYMAHVAPGKTETLVWQFSKAGEFYYGCLVPGHFEAGMIGKIRVLAKGDSK
jgi:uncharacterized cupredoxin-like copper-binding protein